MMSHFGTKQTVEFFGVSATSARTINKTGLDNVVTRQKYNDSKFSPFVFFILFVGISRKHLLFHSLLV